MYTQEDHDYMTMALAQAKVPADAVSLLVVGTEAKRSPLLSQRCSQPLLRLRARHPRLPRRQQMRVHP